MQSVFWNLTFILDVSVYLNEPKSPWFWVSSQSLGMCIKLLFFTPFPSVSCTDTTPDQRHLLCPASLGSEAADPPTAQSTRGT